ncbi:Hypothetical predicted protein [Pelobates cultripes]|uniref:Uncharacterized protein n=1 Tax=Pelobates cultripes TaxID=61616 RepID=A0AAD1RBG8_PELCU|nr:Hypothetical predicted protein [Pelobates cultripes]
MPFLFPATSDTRCRGSRAYHAGGRRLTRDGSFEATLDLFAKHIIGASSDDTMGRKNPRLSQLAGREGQDIGQMLTTAPRTKDAAPQGPAAQHTLMEDSIPDLGSLLLKDSDTPSTKGDIYNLHMQKLFTTDIAAVRYSR